MAERSCHLIWKILGAVIEAQDDTPVHFPCGQWHGPITSAQVARADSSIAATSSKAHSSPPTPQNNTSFSIPLHFLSTFLLHVIIHSANPYTSPQWRSVTPPASSPRAPLPSHPHTSKPSPPPTDPHNGAVSQRPRDHKLSTPSPRLHQMAKAQP